MTSASLMDMLSEIDPLDLGFTRGPSAAVRIFASIFNSPLILLRNVNTTVMLFNVVSTLELKELLLATEGEWNTSSLTGLFYSNYMPIVPRVVNKLVTPVPPPPRYNVR